MQEKFKVSEDTARRDLRILEEKGLINRTHGGALSIKQIGFGGCHDFSAMERIVKVKDNHLSIANGRRL